MQILRSTTFIAIILIGTNSKFLPPGNSQVTIDEAILNAKLLAEKVGKQNPHSQPNTATDVVQVDDMLFPKEHWEIMQSHDTRTKRKAMRSMYFGWPGDIPYEIKPGEFSNGQQKSIRDGIAQFSGMFCRSFRPATENDTYRLVITREGGCSSFIGRQYRRQPLSLAPGCVRMSTILHELGHAIGFGHEHQRSDRDTYIRVHYEKLSFIGGRWFIKIGQWQYNNYSVPYDYLSIMHYGAFEFSKNGRRTITPTNPWYRNRIGRAHFLSFRDVKLANLLYSCAPQRCARLPCPGEGFRDKNCNCLCPTNLSHRPTQICVSKPLTTTRPTTRAYVTGKCQNVLENLICKMFVEMKYCTHVWFKSYMMTKCRKSCTLCSDTDKTTTKKPEKCQNLSPDNVCENWAKKLYCNNPKYSKRVRSRCRRSCKVCIGTGRTTTPTPATTQKKDCKDLLSRCPSYFRRGLCKTHRLVAAMCKTTCKIC